VENVSGKVLSVEGIGKSYKEKQVLKDISFSVHESEIIYRLCPPGNVEVAE
jgi:ABC-2 type transport system ATP-binding protein